MISNTLQHKFYPSQKNFYTSLWQKKTYFSHTFLNIKAQALSEVKTSGPLRKTGFTISPNLGPQL